MVKRIAETNGVKVETVCTGQKSIDLDPIGFVLRYCGSKSEPAAQLKSPGATRVCPPLTLA